MVDPIAIGDEVVFSRSDDGTGFITEVLQRKRKLSRLAAGKNPLEQVIVSNADQVIPVFATAKPKPKWKLLDRYLANAEATGHPVTVCITKLDLADHAALNDDIALYRRIGYPVILTSAVTGEGLEELKPEMRPYIGSCRFGLSCSHTHEPGCAIKTAVETGDIAYHRYGSYLSMKE